MSLIKGDEIIGEYTKDSDIKKIVNIIKSKPLEKRHHFYTSAVYGRDLSGEFIDKTFLEFNKVKLIKKRKHLRGDIGYDFYYQLSKSRTLLLCFIPRKNKTWIINAILKHRKWQNFIRPINPRY